MAVFVQQQALPVRATTSRTRAATSVGKAAVDSRTEKDNGAAVGPERFYVACAVIFVVVGGVVGTHLHDCVPQSGSNGVMFDPPAGVGIFALFYIIAQAIERFLEFFAPYLPTAKQTRTDDDQDKDPRLNQLQAKAALERAYVATARAGTAAAVANAKRTVDQARANLSVLMFGSASLLAMVIAGYLKAGLLQTVGVSGIHRWVDVVITGVVIGAGTKPLHDLISNIQASKESRQDPVGTK